MSKKNFIPFTDVEERLANKLSDTVSAKRINAEVKHPIFFGLFTTFGFVSVLYGFEKLIDRVDLFVNNPWILLATGVLTLLATGTIYTKLH